MKRAREEQDEAFERVVECCRANYSCIWPCALPLDFAVRFKTIEDVRAIVDFGSACAEQRPGDVAPFAAVLLNGYTETDYTDMVPFAAYRGDLDIVRYLCELGADVSCAYATEKNAFHEAASFDRRDVLEYLLRAGTDVNALNTFGETALFVAVDENLPDLVRFLIERGVDVNVRNAFGRSAISECLRHLDGSTKTIVDILIASGAEITENDGQIIQQHYPDLARRYSLRLTT